MDFHPTDTPAPKDALLVCRNARSHLLLLLGLLWAFGGLAWYMGAPWIAFAWMGLTALVTWPILRSSAKRGRSENWVLAVTASGLWVNLRDCAYPEVEPGNTVVFLPYSEVQLARHVTHRYKTRNGESDTSSHKDTYLDLQIASRGLDQIREELQAERQRRSPLKKHFGGIETLPGRIRQQPAQVVDDLLRVKFTAGNYGLLPRPKKVLDVLSKYIVIDEAAGISTGETSQQSDAEFAELVSKMVAEGRDIEAIKLIRERTGKSLTEAKVFVDELRLQLP